MTAVTLKAKGCTKDGTSSSPMPNEANVVWWEEKLQGHSRQVANAPDSATLGAHLTSCPPGTGIGVVGQRRQCGKSHANKA